jgi:hypothetical protein
MTKPPPPPDNISLFVEVLGLDDTLRLIEAHGGTHLWIPKGVDNSSVQARKSLEQQFGEKMVKELIAGFGGEHLEVPLCHEWRTALHRHQGLSYDDIARKLNCHRHTVRRRLNRLAGIADQHSFRF